MSELLKFLKSLKAKGFATIAEKAKAVSMLKELVADEAELVADQVADVEALPVEDNTEDDVVKSIISKAKAGMQSEIASEVAKAKAEMDASIKAFMDEQKELAKAKAGTHADGVKERRAKHSEYLRNLTKAVIANDLAKVKELTTGAGVGGDIVDSELSAEIRHLMTEYGVARREFFVTPLSKNSYEANALTTDVAISWVAEGSVIPTVSVVTAQTELKLKKLGAIAVMSNELLEDQEIDLFSFIAGRVAEGFAKAEDKAFFIGAGSGDTTNGEFTGLLNVAGVTTVEVATVSAITLEDVYAMIDALPEGAQANAKFYGHRTIKSVLRLLKDGDGRYIFNDPINQADMSTLAGKPFVTVEVMPTASAVGAEDSFLILGDLRKATILGYKDGIAVEQFTGGVVRNVAGNADVNLITTDRQAIRWVSRAGYIAILPSAFVTMSQEA